MFSVLCKVGDWLGERAKTAFGRCKGHLPYLGLALTLYVMMALYFVYSNDWHKYPVSPTSDLNVHIPRAYRLEDPRLYSRDPAFNTFGWDSFERLDQLLFPAMLGKLLPIFGGVRTTLVLLSIALGATFVVGIYFLTYYFGRDPLAGVVAALLASFNYYGLGGIQLGFFPNNVYPRNFVVALSPFIIVMFLHWRDSSRLWIPYALLGLVANFHSLAALHLTLMLTAAIAISSRFSWRVLRRVFLGVGLCIICAAPAMVAYVPELSAKFSAGISTDTASSETLTLMARYGFSIIPPLESTLIFVLTALPLVITGGFGFRVALTSPGARRSMMAVYLALYGLVLILPWVGVAVNTQTLAFHQLELPRITRYYAVLSFVPIAMLIAGWMKRRERIWSVAAAGLLLVVLILSRRQTAAIALSKGIGLLWPRQVAATAETAGDKQEDRVEPVEMVWNYGAFSELCVWADSNTPVDAIFLTPTDWSHFRIYSRRGLLAAYKGTSWKGWAELYATVSELYSPPDAEGLVDVAVAHEADYVVVMQTMTLPGLDRIYENEYYAVYKVR